MEKKDQGGFVKRRAHRAYVVALTGLASRRDRDEAKASGFDDFLTKPVSFKKVGGLFRAAECGKGSEEVMAVEVNKKMATFEKCGRRRIHDHGEHALGTHVTQIACNIPVTIGWCW